MRRIGMVIAGAALLLGVAAIVGAGVPIKRQTAQPVGSIEPVWSEAKWPFPIDQWGTGKAFVCVSANCGAEVAVYIRPKIGFCNCATGVSDDAELERVADTEFMGRQLRPRSPGRPIKVGWMHGLSRAYWASDGEAKEGLLSVAFNDGSHLRDEVVRYGPRLVRRLAHRAEIASVGQVPEAIILDRLRQLGLSDDLSYWICRRGIQRHAEFSARTGKRPCRAAATN